MFNREKTKSFYVPYPTLDEIGHSQIPDSSLDNLSLKLTNSPEEWYFLSHKAERRTCVPYIGLYSDVPKTSQKFADAERVVAEAIGGTLGANENVDSGCYRSLRIIDLPENPSQARIADFIEELTKHFREVMVTSVTYKNVPESAISRTGIGWWHMFEGLDLPFESTSLSYRSLGR